MKNGQFYKPSNKFSAVGFILLLLSTAASGALLSWIYLLINSVVKYTSLRALIAVLVSAVIGILGGFLVKTFKIRSTAIALIAVIIGLAFANYAKWAIYVNRDYDEFCYDDMKNIQADEYYYIYTEDFEDTEDFVSTLKDTPASLLMSESTTEDLKYLTAEEINSLKNDSLWDYLEFDDILGTDAETIEKSISKSSEMNAYDFTFEYRGLKAKTVGYLMTHPVEMFKDIKDINEVGRWTYGKSYSTIPKEPINGIMLWIVWLGELLVLTLPAICVVYNRASFPFIESENNWAVEEKTDGAFRFYARSRSGVPVNYQSIKKEMKNDSSFIFTLQAIPAGTSTAELFYSVSYCHSRDYSENYITLTCYKVVQKGKTQPSVLIKNMSADADFIATLYGMFGYSVPAMCHGTDRHNEYFHSASSKPETPSPEDIFNQPVSFGRKNKTENDFAREELEKEKS